MPPRSRYTAGRQVVVISAPDVPAAAAAEVVRVANRELPGLVARYRLPGRHPRAPVIFMTDSWDAAQRVSGVPMPHEAVGAEYAGSDLPRRARVVAPGRRRPRRASGA